MNVFFAAIFVCCCMGVVAGHFVFVEQFFRNRFRLGWFRLGLPISLSTDGFPAFPAMAADSHEGATIHSRFVLLNSGICLFLRLDPFGRESLLPAITAGTIEWSEGRVRALCRIPLGLSIFFASFSLAALTIITMNLAFVAANQLMLLLIPMAFLVFGLIMIFRTIVGERRRGNDIVREIAVAITLMNAAAKAAEADQSTSLTTAITQTPAKSRGNPTDSDLLD